MASIRGKREEVMGILTAAKHLVVFHEVGDSEI